MKNKTGYTNDISGCFLWAIALDTAMGEFRNPLINNCKVLIPMALDEDFIFANINAVVR